MNGHLVIAAARLAAAHDRADRAVAILLPAIHTKSLQHEPWWRWSFWLALGITHRRIVSGL